MKILYVQAIRLDSDLCRSSRLGVVQALQEAGCQVTMIASYDRVRPSMPRGAILRSVRALGVPYLAQLWFSIAAHALSLTSIVTWRPTVVLVDPYTFHCAFPFDVLARLGLIRLRTVMDVRSGIFHVRHRRAANAFRRLLQKTAFTYGRIVFSGFTTISPMLRDTLVREFGLMPARIGIWESGVLPESMRIDSAVAGRPGFRVLYHGTFGPDRGLLESVEAMRLIARTRSDIELLFLGSGTEEAALRRAAEGLTNVRFHPAVPHERIPEFLADCDAGILPFKPTEVMRSSRPLKLMEYIAASRPVIASRIEAVLDVAGNDGAVYLESQAPEDIAKAIAWAADHPDTLANMAAHAHASAMSRFTWQEQGLALRDFLTKLA